MGFYFDEYKRRLNAEARRYGSDPIDFIGVGGVRIAEPQAIYYAPFARRMVCFAAFGAYALTFSLDNSCRLIPAILVDDQEGSSLYGLRDEQWTYMNDACFNQESIDASLRRLAVLVERMKAMGQSISNEHWRPYLHDAIAIPDVDLNSSKRTASALSQLGFKPTAAATLGETGTQEARIWIREPDHELRALELERVE